jgi:hypothetical protein
VPQPPGEITDSVHYSQITAVSSRYMGTLFGLLRFINQIYPPDYKTWPLARVRIQSTECERIECRVKTIIIARKLLLLLASRTRVDVRLHWMDRLPMLRSRLRHSAGQPQTAEAPHEQHPAPERAPAERRRRKSRPRNRSAPSGAPRQVSSGTPDSKPTGTKASRERHRIGS